MLGITYPKEYGGPGGDRIISTSSRRATGWREMSRGRKWCPAIMRTAGGAEEDTSRLIKKRSRSVSDSKSACGRDTCNYAQRGSRRRRHVIKRPEEDTARRIFDEYLSQAGTDRNAPTKHEGIRFPFSEATPASRCARSGDSEQSDAPLSTTYGTARPMKHIRRRSHTQVGLSAREPKVSAVRWG